MKNDVNVPSKSNMQKIRKIYIFFVGIVKVTDEMSRMLIRIRTKYHGSGTQEKIL
jgi:hypothetical protein